MPKKFKNHYPDDYDSAEDFENAVTLLSPHKKATSRTKKKGNTKSPKKNTVKKETPRNRSHSAPPSRTGHDLWINAVKNRQTLGLSGGRHPESPRHKTPTEYWVDTLRRTGVGISTESRSMNSLSGLKKNDLNMAYLSTSSYLRQKAGTEKNQRYDNPTTKPPTGTPAYKSPEEYYDQVLELKKQIKSLNQEMSSLRAKMRRTEEDNIKKEKEIGGLLDPTKNEEMRRTLGEKNTESGAVIQSLKQKILKLENQIRDKESAYAKIQSDMKTTKVDEMKVQLEMCYQEIVRLQNSRDTGLDKSVRSGKENSAKVKALNQTIIRLNKQNEELQTEIRTLKEDLNREIDGREKGLSKDYEDMNRKQLLGAIRELEKRLEKSNRTGGDDISSASLDRAEKKHAVKGKIELSGSVQDRLDQLDKRETELLEEVEKQRKTVRQLKDERSTDRQKMKEYEKLISDLQAEIDYLSDRGGTARAARQGSRTTTSPRTTTPHSQTPRTQTPRTPSGRRQSSRPPSARKMSVDSTTSEDRRRLREEEEVERFRKEHAARNIQRGWKSHRKDQQEAKERLELAEKHREVVAARKIQRSWKTHHRQKQQEHEEGLEKLADDFRKNKAAAKIQKSWKLKQDRELQKKKEEELKKEKEKEEEEALNAKVENFRQNRAARKIQHEWTGFKYRKHEAEVDEATELIQASLRGHQNRNKKVKRYMSEYDDYDDDEDDESYNEAVDLIQSSVKGHYNRKKKMKTYRFDSEEEEVAPSRNVFSASTSSGRVRPGSAISRTSVGSRGSKRGTSSLDRPSSRGMSRRPYDDSYDDDDDIEGF